jgi:olfactory receptor
MTERNKSVISQFLLLACLFSQSIYSSSYVLLLTVYLIAILGNLLVQLDSLLHTPMYLFLSNLSFSDLCFTCVTIPNMLQNIQSQIPSINYAGNRCIYTCFLLTWRASSLWPWHIIALWPSASPLRYTSFMSPKLCACWLLMS